MIDCENEVYTRVVTKLREGFSSDIATGSEYVATPASFPYVSILQTDSYTIDEYQTNELADTLIGITFTVNIYSNKTSGKKSQCKSLAKIIDDAFQSMNFRRTALTPVDNTDNTSIYRLVAQYRGCTDGTHFYRR